MFGGKKDVLYSYLSQDDINWRKVIYRITYWLLMKVTMRNDHKKSKLPTVLIADDTDLPKAGFHMKAIGKVSHMYTIRNKVLFEYLEVVAVVAEITGAESEDLNMPVIENDKRLDALKAYAMTV